MNRPVTVDRPTASHRLALAQASDKLSLAFVVVAAITVAGGLLRFSTLGLQSYWYDEATTAWLAHSALGNTIGASFHETTPPTYYVLVWAWAKLFSNSEVALRSLSALAGTLTVPAAYFAALQGARSRRIAVIASALVATSPLLVWYSQEARDYALQVLFTVLSLGFLARVLDQPRRGALIGWVICSAAALATHYFAAFLIVPEAIWLVVAARGRFVKRALVAAGCVAAVELALVPIALAQRGNGAAWIGATSFRTRLLQVPKQFAVGLQSGFDRPATVLVAILCAVAVYLVVRRASGLERRGATLFAGLGAAVIALPLALALVGSSYLLTRNVIAACVPFLLALAAAFGARRAGVIGPAAAVSLCAVGLAVCISVFATPQYRRADWRGLAQTIGPTQQSRAVVINYNSTPLLFYLPGAVDLSNGFLPQDPVFGPYRHAAFPQVASQGIAVTELDVVEIAAPSPVVSLCWWGAQCNLAPGEPGIRPPLSTRRLPPGLVPAGMQRSTQFTVLRFKSSQPLRLTPADMHNSSLAGATVVWQPGSTSAFGR